MLLPLLLDFLMLRQERDVGGLLLLPFNTCLVITHNLNTMTRKGKEQYCSLQQAQCPTQPVFHTDICSQKHTRPHTPETLDPTSLWLSQTAFL